MVGFDRFSVLLVVAQKMSLCVFSRKWGKNSLL